MGNSHIITLDVIINHDKKDIIEKIKYITCIAQFHRL